jgi:DNA-binding response OmpR family regulator
MNDKPLVLLVEDSKKIQAINKMEFEERGFSVQLAFTIAEAKSAVKLKTPGLIILDINMPDGDGLDFLREYRAEYKEAVNVPVLVLTGYSQDTDIIKGFESGCNDYLAKPYTFPVLFMRAKELLKRSGQLPHTTVQKGALELDIISGLAFFNGKDLLLNHKEFALLLLLVQNENTTLSVEYIYEKIWNDKNRNDKRSLQTRISAIRKKFEDNNYNYTIRNSYGKGYCFEKL